MQKNELRLSRFSETLRHSDVVVDNAFAKVIKISIFNRPDHRLRIMISLRIDVNNNRLSYNSCLKRKLENK